MHCSARLLDLLALDNIGKEIESMANDLPRRYETFTQRLLRSQFRPERSSASRAAAIRRDRREIDR